MKKLRLVAFLLVHAPAIASISSAQMAVETGWTIVREDLEVFLDPAAERMRLKGMLVVRLDRDETSPGPDLVMNSRAPVLRFEQIQATGATTELNVSHPSWSQGVLARVRFPEPKRRGDEVTLSFECQSSGRSRQFVVRPSGAFVSWTEAWYPVAARTQETSLGAMTKCSGTTKFHLPSGWSAVTNGALRSSIDESGSRVEVWETEIALSRSFAAGEYRVTQASAEGMDVSFYLLSDGLPEPEQHAESLAQAIAAMEEGWGPYPYPAYAVAEVPADVASFGGSSEQGFIAVHSSVLEVPGEKLPLFAHEASHGWWGNTVGTTGFFLSEALAQYGAVIAAESVWGKEEAIEFLRFAWPGFASEHSARGYFGFLAAGLDTPMSQLRSSTPRRSDLVDAKGHWVFHMLRRRVGDERFFGTLRELIEKYAGSSLSLAALRSAFQAAAPEAGLEQFFAQWLDRTGAPVLVHDWHETKGAVEVTVLQLQEGEPFELWLDVAIEFMDGTSKTERVQLAGSEETFEIAVEGQPDILDVRLDPRHELLVWAPGLGPAPDPILEDLKSERLSAERIACYVGEYDVSDLGVATVEEEGGQLVLSMPGAPRELLVSTGGHRFLGKTAYVVFEVINGRADSFQTLEPMRASPVALRRN